MTDPNAEAAFNAIGFIGGIAVALSSPFQLYKSLKTRSTRDISFGWITSYLLGIYLIFVYGFYFRLPPIWGPVLLEITCGTSLFILKVKLDYFEGRTYTRTIATQTSDTTDEENASERI